MSAYDNPKIIEDMYGAKAYANAATQLSQTIVSGFQTMVENRNKQADIAAKKKDLWNTSYVESEIKATEAANANWDQMEADGKPKGIIDQAKELFEAKMYGGTHMINGVEREFGKGSLFMATESKMNSSLDPTVRKDYIKKVTSVNKLLKSSSEQGALILTDEKIFDEVVGGTEGFYWNGSSDEEKYNNYLASSSLYNKEMGGGIIQEKVYDIVEVDGEEQSTVTVNSKIPENSKQAAFFSDRKKYPLVNGMINVEWKKNLSDGSWDGNFVNESTVKPIEYNKEGENSGVIDDGKLSSNYQHQLTGSISKGDTIDKKEILTFVNVDGGMSNMSNIVDGRADQIANMVLRGSDLQKADAYHYLETMGFTGVNYAQEFKDKKITEKQIESLFSNYINEDMKTHFKLGMERDPATGKFVNQQVNGLELKRRIITQDQIDELAEANVDVTNIKAGTEQYFYVDSAGSSKSKDGNNNNSTGNGDANEREIAKSKKALNESEEEANTYFTVARTLGAGTGGRKLIYNPDNKKYQVEDKEGEPIGMEMTYEEAKKLYR